MVSRARLALFALVAVTAVTIVASPTAAMRGSVTRGRIVRHLKLLKSSPTADAVLTTAPDAVRLWLSEPADVPATKISITSTAGAAIATAAVMSGNEKDAPLVALITKPLAKGSYKVTWKAMSKDGHVVKGTFGFSVAASK